MEQSSGPTWPAPDLCRATATTDCVPAFVINPASARAWVGNAAVWRHNWIKLRRIREWNTTVGSSPVKWRAIEHIIVHIDDG